MSKTTKIVDGGGSGIAAKVSPEGFLYTQEAPYPPTGEDAKISVYREFITLNGDGATSTIEAATAGQVYYIQAEPDVDIYITSLSFLIAESGASLQEFGGSAPLATGCRLYYEDQNGEINIGTNLTTNFDFVRLCQGNPAFGDGNTAFLGQNVVPTNIEAYFPVLDFRQFGFKWGLKLSAGTLNRLILEVNDNIAALGLTSFNAIAYGFRRILD